MALMRNGIPDLVEDYARRLAGVAGPAVEAMAEADPRTPRGSKPHPGPRIADSFRVGPGAALRGTTVVVKASNVAPHAEYVERGTPPHEIRPRSARVLRFEADGGIVFARRVNHPGTQPAPWFDAVIGDAWERALATAVLIV